jgi:hypothetical protein
VTNSIKDSSDSTIEGDNHHNYLCYQENKRKTVFNFLDKDPLLTASSLAQMIGIPSHERKKETAYLKYLKYQWKGNHGNQRGSIRSIPDDVHNAFYKGTLPVNVISEVFLKLRSLAYGYGSNDFFAGAWVSTKSKNKFILFKSRLGRIRLFSTGTVELFVKKPANDGKCMQLFCDAFTKTKLVDSIKIIEDFRKTLMRRMHCTFDMHQKLPYIKITAFQETNNFVMTSGDRSHPTCIEFMFGYNNEVQSVRDLVEQMGSFFKRLQDYSYENVSGSSRRLSSEGEYSR